MHATMNYRRLFWTLGILAAVFLVCFILLSNRLGATRQEESALQATLTSLEEGNQEMETQLKLASTEDYIVSSAMTEYAFMNKNDLRFEFTNPEALYAYTREELAIYNAEKEQ